MLAGIILVAVTVGGALLWLRSDIQAIRDDLQKINQPIDLDAGAEDAGL